jgi:beta-glucosidase-like glycosyl hydrolase
MPLSPIKVLKDAQDSVPAVRWAKGVAGVVAVVAIISGFEIDFKFAIFGTIIVFGFMFVLITFSALDSTRNNRTLILLASFAAWAFVLLSIAVCISLFTSYFFCNPLDLCPKAPPHIISEPFESSIKLVEEIEIPTDDQVILADSPISIQGNVIEIYGQQYDLNDPEVLKRFLGQIFIIGADETAFTTADLKWKAVFDTLGIGGVMLNNRNLVKSETVGMAEMETISLETFNHKVQNMLDMRLDGNLLPRFIAMDHEGGTVGQLMKRKLASELPAQMALASLRSLPAVKTTARISARELSSLGINVNFGPVIDLNVEKQNRDIRDRSFGDQPSEVRVFARHFIEEHKKLNVLTFLKHFPGHGHTLSGFDTPDVPVSHHLPSTIKASISPFRNLSEIATGIMTSHMKIDSLGVDNVTTNSRIVRDLIRGNGKIDFNGLKMDGLNYRGLIITDDLNEVSLTSTRSKGYECNIGAESDNINVKNYIQNLKSEVLAAFDAGHDLLLFSHVREVKPDNVWIKKRADWCARWAISLEEFVVLFEHIKTSIFSLENEQQQNRIAQLRDSIIRILKVKNEYLYKNKLIPPQTYQKMMRVHEKCLDIIRKGSITFLLSPSRGSKHHFSSVRQDDSAVLFSFLKDKNLYATKVGTNLSDAKLQQFWYRYHTGMVDRLKSKFGGNLDIVQLKNNPYRGGEIDEEKVVLDRIIKTLAKLNEKQKRTHIIFLIDTHHAGWRVVQRFIKENLDNKGNVNKYIDPSFIYSVILRNPSILRDQIDEFRNSSEAIAELVNSNIIVFYSAYGQGTKFQLDSLMGFKGEESVSTLPIVVEHFNPSVSSLRNNPNESQSISIGDFECKV